MEWINIKDKIPEVLENVIVWNGTLNQCEIQYRLNEYYEESSDLKNKYAWNEQGIFNNIEYWMPLPNQPDRLNPEDHFAISDKVICDSQNSDYR